MISKTRVKICSITNLDDALMAARYGADALGFIFCESKRQIMPDMAKNIIRQLPPFITCVGVFMNQPFETVRDIASQTGVNAIQLHGDETPGLCNQLNRKIIKRIKVTGTDTRESLLDKMEPFSNVTCLLDPGAGDGKVFNWAIASDLGQPVIIAGGLKPENVRSAVEQVHPYAVDVSSGVEMKIGKKDPEKIKRFIQEVQ